MNVSVLIPFTGTDPHRLAALAHVQARYEALGWQICLGRTPGPWCKAKAVTAALNTASGDVLVVADADCISDGTTAAVQAVTDGAPWAMPHKRVNRLTETATQLVLNGEAPSGELGLDQPPYIGTPAGGIVALTRHAWQSAPLDPRFTGWGQEDEAWSTALTALVGPPTRLRHDLWHLWHPPQPRLSRRIGSEAGAQLGARYRAARRNPAAMAALIDEGRRHVDPSRLMAQTATLHHVTQTGDPDEYNDPTLEETTETVACLLQQGTRVEADGLAVTSTDIWALYLPAGTNVDTLDYITVDGVDYHIDGRPWPAFNPRTRAVSHIEATVKRAA